LQTSLLSFLIFLISVIFLKGSYN